MHLVGTCAAKSCLSAVYYYGSLQGSYYLFQHQPIDGTNSKMPILLTGLLCLELGGVQELIKQ